MTQRIGTGASAQITQYAATVTTTPLQLETSVPEGGITSGAYVSQSASPATVRLLATGPVNPTRFYVQGLTIYNADAALTIYVGSGATSTTTAAFPIPAGASLRVDCNRGDGVFLFTTAGTATCRVLGL